MSVSLPPGFCPSSFSMRLNTVELGSSPPHGGSMQVLDLMNDWWTVSMGLPPRSHANAAALEAFLDNLRGMTQIVYLHHLVRPVPRGTLRGTPESWGAVAGSRVLRVTGEYGKTLNAGDMIGVEGQLLRVAEDIAFVATIEGVPGAAYIPLSNALRKNIVGNSPVIWDRPTAAFRCVSPTAVQYVPGYAEGLTLDFIEDVTL